MIALPRALRLWSHRRLESRIGIAIVTAIGAILALALLQLLFIPHGKVTVFQRAWLMATIQDVVTKVNAASPLDRARLIDQLPERKWLAIAWSATQPTDDGRPRPPPPPHLDQRLEKDLETALKGGMRAVKVSLLRSQQRHPPRRDNRDPPPHDAANVRAEQGAAGPPHARRWPNAPEYVLAIIPAPSSASDAASHDDLVPAIFDIKLQIADGSWLRIIAKQAANNGWMLDLLVSLVGGSAIVVILSIYTARRILAPLNALTTAAQNLGIQRTHMPIPTTGLEEFATVADALNDMHGRLSGFVEERTKMLAAISHDLRTSLTRLSLGVEDVQDAALKQTLNEEIAEMESMIAATLVFARNDAQNEASAEIDLAALLISLCDDEVDKGNSASYSGPNHLVVRCQRLSVKRALANIIENALKYGERVAVDLRQVGRQAEIIVRDWGPGIPTDMHERAFAPFQRLETSRNRSTGGVGLGLTIARDAIRAHMGQIELENSQDQGLRVRITLPC